MARDALYHRRRVRDLPFFAKAAQAYEHMKYLLYTSIIYLIKGCPAWFLIIKEFVNLPILLLYYILPGHTCFEVLSIDRK